MAATRIPLLAFLTSLDEVVVALFVSGGPMATPTPRMFTGLRDQVDPTIAAISSLLMAISMTLLGAARWLAQRRRGGDRASRGGRRGAAICGRLPGRACPGCGARVRW